MNYETTIFSDVMTYNDAVKMHKELSKTEKCSNIIPVINTSKTTVDPKTLNIWQFGIMIDIVNSNEDPVKLIKETNVKLCKVES